MLKNVKRGGFEISVAIFVAVHDRLSVDSSITYHTVSNFCRWILAICGSDLMPKWTNLITYSSDMMPNLKRFIS